MSSRRATGTPSTPDGPGNTEVVGARIAAQIVDLIAMFLLTLAVVVLLAAVVDTAAGAQLLGLGSFVAVALGYGTVLEGGWNGQTLGKRALGVRVVDRRGEPVGFAAALVRNVPALFGSWLTWLVGVAAIAVSDRNQRLFDMAADTYVVKA